MLIVLPGLVYGRYSGLGEKEPPINTDYRAELKKREEKKKPQTTQTASRTQSTRNGSICSSFFHVCFTAGILD
jgi:hypothetical protein